MSVLNKSNSTGPKFSLKTLFRTLNSRNYRLYFGGQGVSLIGTWMQQIAMSWLVYRITNSVFLLGVAGFASQIPTFVLSPFAGVLVDKWNAHRIMVFTQVLYMLQAFTLWILVYTGHIDVWHIIVLSLVFGIITSFDTPARHSFIIELVNKREDLSNAIALNSAMFNGARLIGPTIAGITIAYMGEGNCFLVNAISYMAVIAALLAMRIKPKVKDKRLSNMFKELKEGFSYTFGFLPVRSLLLLIALINLMGVSYSVLMPVIAKDILHGGAHTLGFLMAAAGSGALTGALYLASRRTVRGLSKKIAQATTIFSLGLIALSFANTFWICVVIMFFIGLGLMVQMASSNTIIQTIVDDDKRGRVMSFYAISFMGISPFGSLLSGGVSNLIGVQYTLLIGGVICLIGVGFYTRKLPDIRAIVRPIYASKGIIPEIAEGIKQTEN
jgi:MFS family permease